MPRQLVTHTPARQNSVRAQRTPAHGSVWQALLMHRWPVGQPLT
jgi:hypothetical protein